MLGGGGVAERKVESLLRCGGAVTVISPDLTPRLKELLSHSKIQHLCREYQRGDFEDAFLVFVATNDPMVNAESSQEALGKGILVNTVDTPKRCNFIVPSVVDRDDLVITISTSGKSPALAKKIREKLETGYGEEYSIFLTIMGAVRERLLKAGNNSEKNRKIFYRLVDSNMLALIKEGKKDKVDSILLDALGKGYSLGELGVDL
ncbi:MAG: bifunctional precorrin-2 dehydrogenase/sirohydrochlorin ferrochelatase [Desulfobacterales bacterium]|nr:bifunctional precorrin-2 dehydrogenase/sirohydrochlorin ferrochelatase [Desulfobacterales bacterium]